MKQFDSSKLNNHSKLTKKKFIVVLSLFMVFTIIGVSFALYNVSPAEKVVITSSVGEFVTDDLLLSVYVDGEERDDFPAKSEGYILRNVVCENNSGWKWNSADWKLEVRFSGKDECLINFTRVYSDGVVASVPELYEGMLPVVYDASGNVVVADYSTKWYDYANHEWANAVLVDNSNATIKAKYFNEDMTINRNAVGQIVSLDEILQMYVWIPRYNYKLFNASNGSAAAQAIEIQFVSNDTKASGTANGQMLTHPAFTFGDTELNGIWVGKFEMTGTQANPTIKPSSFSLNQTSLSQMFEIMRNMDLVNSAKYGINTNQVDTHVLKNMDWGAVAYLSHSIYGRYVNSTTCIASGCEVWINNANSGTGDASVGDRLSAAVTGCSGTATSSSTNHNMTACAAGYDWKTNGVNASTTGNQYGIYDMRGGTWETVMGVLLSADGINIELGGSGFTVAPDPKYYDVYSYSTTNDGFTRSKLGDATKETLVTAAVGRNGWYGDEVYMIFSGVPWVIRGGRYNLTTRTGLFATGTGGGGATVYDSFRGVLTAED